MVSTIITSYNKGPYLAEAIHSALRQEYRPHEVVVIDDGSTDCTHEVATTFGGQVRYYYQTNGGPSSAKNRGILLARGEYIAFLDGDDRWCDGKVKRQVELLSQNADIGVVYGQAIVFNEVTGSTSPFLAGDSCLHRGRVLDQLLASNFIPFSSAMVRRSCLVGAGMFDETVRRADDYDLWLRIARKHKFDFVDDILVEYRVGIDQIGNQYKEQFTEAMGIQTRFIQRFYDGHYPRPSVLRSATAAKYAAYGNVLLAKGSQLGALAAHYRSLRLDPLNAVRYVSVLRDLVPNCLVAALKRFGNRARSCRG